MRLVILNNNLIQLSNNILINEEEELSLTDYILDNFSIFSNNNISIIGISAFTNCKSLTTISFPKCTTISNYAFYNCASLTSVSFPNCTTINFYAFGYCYSLTAISFPECTTIGAYAFRSCTKLTTISFPECTSIGASAFTDCKSLTTISFPKCTNIYSDAFQSCNRLVSLYLMNSSVCTLDHQNAFSATPIAGYTASTGGVYGSIYVPSSLLSSYKTATNWTYYSDRFVGI